MYEQAVMCWNHDGSYLASASQKGTVLRVHRLPQALKVFTFRRGTYPAVIHSMAFSPPSVSPPLLCAASGHGTVHLFRLDETDRCPLS
jgi:autophagy-related protein 18